MQEKVLLEEKINNLCFWDQITDGDVAEADQHYNSKEKPEEKRTFPVDSSSIYHFHPIAFVEHMKLITGGINHTFDNKHTAKANEVYINVITPKSRDLQGPLVVFNSSGVLFKTHSLARGSNSNRLKAEGNGDTPTGKTTTVYYPKKRVGHTSFGNHGMIMLEGTTGEFKKATNNGRTGIAIHSGHTNGYGSAINDKGDLMSTYGCVRVYNSAMKELGKLYTKLKNEGKIIYCYIEDYDGDIKDVYKFYDLKVDPKDKEQSKRSNTQ